jgi:hypothetical protein
VLGALQVEDQQRLIARTMRALRGLQKQLLNVPGPAALGSGACFKATIEVRGRAGAQQLTDCLRTC